MSLPYYDPKPSPDALASAAALIQAEMGTNAPILHFEPIKKPKPFNVIDMQRYTIASESTEKSLEMAKILYQYAEMRQQRIHTLAKYNGWDEQNARTKMRIQQVKSNIEDIKQQTIQINRKRKAMHEEAGEKLKNTQIKWNTAINSVSLLLALP